MWWESLGRYSDEWFRIKTLVETNDFSIQKEADFVENVSNECVQGPESAESTREYEDTAMDSE